jgi:hypothetical protein
MRSSELSVLSTALGALLLIIPVNMFAQKSQSSDLPWAAEPTQRISALELPDSPGAVEAENQNPQQSGSSSSDQTASSPAEQDQKTQHPAGTAAAQAPLVSGITAAQPAGVAIAPAKQHRVRTIVLRVGAILGAGAVLGTTVALTAATPSKPPGAR